MLSQLLSLLEPQITKLGLRKFDMVDVLIHEDMLDDMRPVGDKREEMRNRATGPTSKRTSWPRILMA